MKRRITRSGFQSAVAVALIAYTFHARAEAPGPVDVSVATGYVRGLGSPGGDMPGLQHLAGDGGALRVDAGWRIGPHVSAGAYCESAWFAGGHEGTDGMTGAAAGLQGRLHARPLSKVDPWVGLGFGWRGLWLDHGVGTHAMQGLDLARLDVGVDFQVSRGFRLAPTVGVTVTEVLSEKRPGAGGYVDVEERKVSTFVFAGVTGRIDVLGGGSGAR